MKDLTQCTVSRDDFQRWLDLGHAPITLYQGEKALTVLTRLEKSQSVEYLYRAAIQQDSSISWNNNLTFCGVYDRQNRALYLTKDTLNCVSGGQFPFVSETIPSMVEEICGRVNQRVEETIANAPDSLSVQEITSLQAQCDLQYYQEHGAREEAIRRFFKDEELDVRFHSGYAMDELPETAFLAYIQDPEGFVQNEAEQHIKIHQEKFLLQFLKNDALLTAYQALVQDTGSPIHQMKAITEAIKDCGAKTVTVTVEKDGRELTFKTDASSLTGYKNRYSTYDIPAQDRREFERMFGKYSDYSAEDITKITYGRNTIYEAPPVQTEDMAKEPGMGGMQFG